jgi:hypothetical protein
MIHSASDYQKAFEMGGKYADSRFLPGLRQSAMGGIATGSTQMLRAKCFHAALRTDG